MKRRAARCAITAALVVGLTACDEGKSPKPQVDDGRPVWRDAPKVQVGWVRDHGRRRYQRTGGIDYCTGTTSAARQKSVDRFNALYGGAPVRLIRLPADTWGQYDAFVKRQHKCDVFAADVIATGALAWERRVYDMSRYVLQRRDEFIGNAVRTACYGSKFWGVPHSTNVGLVFFRADRRPQPVSWQEAYRSIVFQGRADEALTVNFLELAVAAGGRVLSGNGRAAALSDGPADRNPNLRALKLMVAAVNDTTATPHDGETATLAAFMRGDADYMRNWPVMYQHKYWSGPAAAVPRRNVRVAPLPLFEGAGVGGVLGGTNLVISKSTRHPEAALAFIDFLTTVDEQKRSLAQFEAPAIDDAYEGSPPSFVGALGDYASGFVRELRRGVKQATPRPVVPGYRDVSTAIATNVRRALEDTATPEEALADAHDRVDEIVGEVPVVARCTG